MTPYEKTQKQADEWLGLPPQYFWEIELPTYTGILQTKCRLLVFTGKEGEKPIISAEWSAGINPAQFWKTPNYAPDKLFTPFGDMYDLED